MKRGPELGAVVVIEGRGLHDAARAGTVVDCGPGFAAEDARLRRLRRRDPRAKARRYYGLVVIEGWYGRLSDARLFLQRLGILVRRPGDQLTRRRRSRSAVFALGAARAFGHPARLPQLPRAGRSKR